MQERAIINVPIKQNSKMVNWWFFFKKILLFNKNDKNSEKGKYFRK